jgi:hypothetical protein
LVQLVWLFFEDLSFLTINSLVSFELPGIPSIIQSSLLKLIYFDILYTEYWLPQFMMNVIGVDLDQVEGDTAMSLQFAENGF